MAPVSVWTFAVSPALRTLSSVAVPAVMVPWSVETVSSSPAVTSPSMTMLPWLSEFAASEAVMVASSLVPFKSPFRLMLPLTAFRDAVCEPVTSPVMTMSPAYGVVASP